MPSNFQQALDIIKKNSSNDKEKGEAFERLTKVFLESDALQKQIYSKVWTYTEWASENPSYSQTDIGIDLVAERRDGSGLCSVQCKNYSPHVQISKEDINSWVSASATSDFTSLLLVDTSTVALGRHAQSTVDNLDKEFNRLPISAFEESRIDWVQLIERGELRLAKAKDPMDHQLEALQAAKDGLEANDRGKIIMACGTGKTYTSLIIAEDIAGKGKLVLYMVPSLALMSQTVSSWKSDSTEEFNAFSACSDTKVGLKGKNNDDIILQTSDLAFPATTDAAKLADQIKGAGTDKMTVIFSTYHSIEVIKKAQKEHGLPEFDLILCDEAHRTTGETLVGEDESSFVKIHNDEHVKGKKRLYMTATPRVYGEKAKSKANEHSVTLADMGDEDIYGPTFFKRNFGWAVENGLLTDYKVIVLALDEAVVSKHAEISLKEGSELGLDDATKLIGCYKALAKIGIEESEDSTANEPMKRAIAFCQNIALSKATQDEFGHFVNQYLDEESKETGQEKPELSVSIKHVDGTFNAKEREECLSWLKDDVEEQNCRILTNARCLSEGVDVPSLDAIMFLHPRKSVIDVVQSVGRVMRRADNKKLGYVILPIAIPANTAADKALNDNERYKVVWQILNALRTHDERFDSTVNRIRLGEDVSDKIQIIDGNPEDAATTQTVEDVKTKKPKKPKDADRPTPPDVEAEEDGEDGQAEQTTFVLDDLSQAIKAKIVEKCGTRDYWETWAKDIAKIAQIHVTRITTIVDKAGSTEAEYFNAFLAEIQDDLNPEISKEEAIEMLAQHLITKPVFDALFKDRSFAAENPVSKAMEKVLDQLHEHNLSKESKSLHNFYKSVQNRADGIRTSSGRQQIILELYEKFFASAFPLLTQKLGLVYTPVEVVDFIIHSVNDILKEEFGKSLGAEGVNIIDPFTGTGTFITRLLQSGLISKEELAHKFHSEIHANEIVLLAYYIAAVNIESVYQDVAENDSYEPYNGIVLTDTFQLYEQDHDMIADLLPDNSNRRTAQKELDINVIIGNPPYSAGQKSANDDAANVKYENLDRRIKETYAEETNKRAMALYDSYIRAFRWASDRIGDEGVIGFVTGAGWIDGNAMDGMRKCLSNEFTKIYIFHLRGNQRFQGERRLKEGGLIFSKGTGSLLPIAITLLVKNPASKEQGQIFFHDIGDYLDQKKKFALINEFKSIQGIKLKDGFKQIEPDDKNDWINQGDRAYYDFISIGNKKDKTDVRLFNIYSNGIKTNRDSWAYNYSRKKLIKNITKTIDFFNDSVENTSELPNSPSCIKWDQKLKNLFQKKASLKCELKNINQTLYRPFCTQNLYKDNKLNWTHGLISKIYPDTNYKNLVICTTGIGARELSCFITSLTPDIQVLFNGQAFPLKTYEKASDEGELFQQAAVEEEYVERDGISDEGYAHFQSAYSDKSFTKDDLFYYIYGLLHSEDYRERFQNNLTKELPRIPAVKKFEDFMAFSKAGRNLAELHLNYETVEPFPVDINGGSLDLSLTMGKQSPEEFYRVTKMKFGGKRPNEDKTTVIYNHNITISNIPLEAYDYFLNEKSALAWVMDRQRVTTDKASGIVNDCNDYANETVGDPTYPLKLFQRVITVSLETMKIVRALPKMEI